MALTAGPASAQVKPSSATAATSGTLKVTEYYQGQTYRLSPTNWHGAKACAIVTPTVAHCFDNAAQLDAFTATPAANPAAGTVEPDGSVVPDGFNCSGYTKIWNGPNWTNIGLAFKDWGYAQNLNSYTQVPFQVISWFSDGQRSYSPNNCPAWIFEGANGTGSGLYLPPDAHAKNLGSPWPTYSIELYHP